MPLRMTHGRAIRMGAPSSPGVKLGVPQKYQQQKNWCWAACAEMVLSYYGHVTEQCHIANWLFNQALCCTSGSSDQCDKGCQVPDVCRVYGNYGIKSAPSSGANVSFAMLQSEISGSRPVEVGLSWRTGGSHLVIVCGWRTTSVGQYVRVNDPSSGPQSILYTDLLAAYGVGQWTHTWIDVR